MTISADSKPYLKERIDLLKGILTSWLVNTSKYCIEYSTVRTYKPYEYIRTRIFTTV